MLDGSIEMQRKEYRDREQYVRSMFRDMKSDNLYNPWEPGMLEYYNIKKKKVYKVLDFKDWFYSLK